MAHSSVYVVNSEMQANVSEMAVADHVGEARAVPTATVFSGVAPLSTRAAGVVTAPDDELVPEQFHGEAYRADKANVREPYPVGQG